MKKTLLVYVLILAGVFIVLTLLDYRGEYRAEKSLWKINAQFAEYTKDPKIIPTGTYEEIRKKYKRFIDTHSKSKLVPLAELHIGHTYMAMKSYDKARQHFEDFIKNHKDNSLLGVQAAVEITRTYALEENEASVIKSYERVIRDFPETDIGLKTPLLMVDFYKNTQKIARAQKALADAELHYKDLIAKHPGTLTEFKALQMLTNCYMEKSDLNGAVNTLEAALLRFPDPAILTPQIMDNIVKSINTICMTQLKDLDRPIKIYSKFAEKYPNHQYTKALNSLIKKFEYLKSQNVGVILDKK